MSEVTQVLAALDAGDLQAANQLLPMVYDELRKLAAGHMASEAVGHTLDATALVHEAYLRLVGPAGDHAFANRRHFFAAAAEAMRRILIEQARAKVRIKRGGVHQRRQEWSDAIPDPSTHPEELLELDDELAALSKLDSVAAELVKLRLFGGCSLAEAAESLSISTATAYRNWEFARAWLTKRLAR